MLISEIFGPTYQGEGPSIGRSCIFLRTSNCNLQCRFCDSPYTWNWIGTKFAHPEKYDRKKEQHKLEYNQVRESILNLAQDKTKMLVISGGEPMLQQKHLQRIAAYFKHQGWRIEVETNATIPLRYEFVDLIDQMNCSPKLANSGDPSNMRIKPEILQTYVDLPQSIFKFVVSSNHDLNEILNLVRDFKIEKRKVWLMPQGRTREELAKLNQQVKQLALGLGYNFSPRKHIEEFGSKRGV